MWKYYFHQTIGLDFNEKEHFLEQILQLEESLMTVVVQIIKNLGGEGGYTLSYLSIYLIREHEAQLEK